jgi:hypothetical protein
VEREEIIISRLQQYGQPVAVKKRRCRHSLGATEAEARVEESLEKRYATLGKSGGAGAGAGAGAVFPMRCNMWIYTGTEMGLQ